VRTVADVMATNKGRTTAFDYLRVALASAVVLDHCVVWGNPAGNPFSTVFGPLLTAVLPAFFAMSGVLVASSLVRNSIPQFVALRVLRIFPALGVEVMLSCFVLGPIFTTLPLAAYFGDPMTHAYLLNMVGFIHYPLPGVFGGEALNPQLWTIPVELDCYVLIVLVGLSGLVRWPPVMAALLIAVLLLATATSMVQSFERPEHAVTGRVLLASFAAGCLIHFLRKRLPHHPALFAGSVAAVLLAFADPPRLAFLAPLPMAYAVAYFGLLRLPKFPFGDLSYGLYLFHMPLIRVINDLTGHHLAWYTLFPAAMLAAGLFAAASWTFVEKPLLHHKAQVLSLVDRLLPAPFRDLAALNPKEASGTHIRTSARKLPVLMPGIERFEPG
jgi:peptidoglycan/LPS O-acetylase OafA/YrhL